MLPRCATIALLGALAACRNGGQTLPPPDPAPPVGPKGAEVVVPVPEGGMPRQAPIPTPTPEDEGEGGAAPAPRSR